MIYLPITGQTTLQVPGKNIPQRAQVIEYPGHNLLVCGQVILDSTLSFGSLQVKSHRH